MGEHQEDIKAKNNAIQAKNFKHRAVRAAAERDALAALQLAIAGTQAQLRAEMYARRRKNAS